MDNFAFRYVEFDLTEMFEFANNKIVLDQN